MLVYHRVFVLPEMTLDEYPNRSFVVEEIIWSHGGFRFVMGVLPNHSDTNSLLLNMAIEIVDLHIENGDSQIIIIWLVVDLPF